jgi:hypothetical protein
VTGPRNTTTEALIDDRDLLEPSPSAGWQETYAALGVSAAGDQEVST